MDEVLNVIPKVFNEDIRKDLEKDVTKDEIKKTVFSMNTDKAPEPDGFSTGFYQKCWEIMGNDICADVGELFRKSKLLSS